MVKITVADNSQVWGNIIRRNKEFLDLLDFDSTHYKHPYPGMLVSCYEGGNARMGERRLGLGLVVAVTPHPKPMGDVRWLCTVVWNFENPPIAYDYPSF